MNKIGNVVIGFYVAYDSPTGNRIAQRYPELDQKSALEQWAKEGGLTFCREYLIGDPTHGAFMGHRIYDVENLNRPWFVSTEEITPVISKAEKTLESFMQENHEIFVDDDHARPEFLVDQYAVRSDGIHHTD